MKKTKLITATMLALLTAGMPLMADDVVKLTTASAAGEQVTLELNSHKKGFTVDWGDGTPVTVTSTAGSDVTTLTGTLKGKVITLTGAKITTVICPSLNLTAIDVTGAPNLLSLYCQDNKLKTLDLTHNAKLSDLNCARNAISTLKVSTDANPILQNVIAASNGMKTLAASGSGFALNNGALQYVDLSDNKFTSISPGVSNTSLDALIAGGNEIARLDVSKAEALTVLMAQDGGKLATLSTPTAGLTQLRQAFLDGNVLTTVSFDESTKLQYLSLTDNKLTQVGFPAKTELYALACGGNALTPASLPSARYQPVHMSYLPQEEIINITSALKKDKNGYYTLVAPSYNDRTKEQYFTDLSPWALDPDDSRTAITFTYYGRNEGDADYKELTKASGSNKDGDFFPQTSSKTFGNVSFLKPYGDVYIKVTSKTYPDLVQTTTHFRTGRDTKVPTGIDGVTVDPAGGLSVSVSGGNLVLTATAEQTVTVYAIDGKATWQGTVGTTPVSVSLPHGAYIVAGKKVIL